MLTYSAESRQQLRERVLRELNGVNIYFLNDTTARIVHGWPGPHQSNDSQFLAAWSRYYYETNYDKHECGDVTIEIPSDTKLKRWLGQTANSLDEIPLHTHIEPEAFLELAETIEQNKHRMKKLATAHTETLDPEWTPSADEERQQYLQQASDRYEVATSNFETVTGIDYESLYQARLFYLDHGGRLNPRDVPSPRTYSKNEIACEGCHTPIHKFKMLYEPEDDEQNFPLCEQCSKSRYSTEQVAQMLDNRAQRTEGQRRLIGFEIES